MIELVIGFLFGTFFMLPIFEGGKNFYMFMIEHIRKKRRERKTQVTEVKL